MDANPVRVMVSRPPEREATEKGMKFNVTEDKAPAVVLLTSTKTLRKDDSNADSLVSGVKSRIEPAGFNVAVDIY